MPQLRCLLLLAISAVLPGSLRAAPILGSTVTGSLFFGSDTTFNGFATGNGGSGLSATVGPGVEFIYADAYNTDTANFSASGLRITDTVGVNAQAFTMIFVDPEFTGFLQSAGGSNFTYTFSNGALRVNFAGSAAPGTYSTTFDYAASAVTPEPSCLVLLATGLSGIAALYRRQAIAGFASCCREPVNGARLHAPSREATNGYRWDFRNISSCFTLAHDANPEHVYRIVVKPRAALSRKRPQGQST